MALKMNMKIRYIPIDVAVDSELESERKEFQKRTGMRVSMANYINLILSNRPKLDELLTAFKK